MTEYKFADKDFKPYYMVFNPKGRKPTVKHKDIQGALKEAERISGLVKGPVYVLLSQVEVNVKGDGK